MWRRGHLNRTSRTVRQFRTVTFAAMGQAEHRGHATNRELASTTPDPPIISRASTSADHSRLWDRGSAHVSVEGAVYAHFREKHGSAVFSSINQHLGCQSAFRPVAL
jgi:hypothetical protein